MGILDNLIQAIKTPARTATPGMQYHVVLGALLSLVAQAEDGIVPKEMAAMREVLKNHGVTEPGELEEVLAASQKTLQERLDWEGFTREINQRFEYEQRVSLVKDLFVIARADDHLSHTEQETIRKIADLLWVSHSDFIKAKLATKRDDR